LNPAFLAFKRLKIIKFLPQLLHMVGWISRGLEPKPAYPCRLINTRVFLCIIVSILFFNKIDQISLSCTIWFNFLLFPQIADLRNIPSFVINIGAFLNLVYVLEHTGSLAVLTKLMFKNRCRGHYFDFMQDFWMHSVYSILVTKHLSFHLKLPNR
jgi:hypothetical protein